MMYFYCEFLVLVNGTSTVFFQSFKGLRLKDPLSPYLFVLAMEGLGCLAEEGDAGRLHFGF